MALTAPRDDRSENDLLAEARRAARRAGMSLPDWLDTVAGGLGETRAPSPRGDRRGAADLLAGLRARLEELERRSARRVARQPYHDENTRLVRHLEERLQALAEQIDWSAARNGVPDGTVTRPPGEPQRDTLASELLNELKGAIGELSARQETLESGFDRAVATYADRVDHRLDMVIERLERRLDEAAPALAIEGLETQVRAIAARLDGEHGGAAAGLHEELVGLVQRLDEVPARIAEDLAPWLEDAARRLDTATRSEVDGIRAEMREIAQEMDRATRSQFEALHEEIANLAQLLGEAGRAHSAGAVGLNAEERAELAAIREEIRALAGGLEDFRGSDHALLRDELRALAERIDSGSADRLSEIERLIGIVVERVTTGQPDLSGIAEIERQIARIAEVLDASSERMSALAEFEETAAELLRRIDEEQASGEAVDALKADFIELRELVESSEERNHDTLGAVRETLDRIVDRLADLEEEIDEVAEDARTPRAPEPNGAGADGEGERQPAAYQEPQIDPDDLVGRIEAVARAFGQEREDNTPIAPGSGAPATMDAEEEDEPRTERLKRQPGERESFIAAARRAAQAASAEQQMKIAVRLDMAEPRPNGFGATLKKYRRPLVAALALAIVVAGAVKLASSLGGVWASAGTVKEATALPVAKVEPAAGPEEGAPRVINRAPAAEEKIETASVPEAVPEPPVQAARPEAAAAPEAAAEAEPAPDPASADAQQEVSAEMPPAEIGSEKLRLAAASGDAAAQFEIGARYTDGRGVGQDFAQAAHWYRLAAAQGSAPAQYRLGSLYEKGHGVTRDPAMARMWYRRAAKQGNRRAMHNLAVLYADGGGGEPDYEKAALWFREASDHGLKDSQYNLAILHGRGLGVEQDLAEAYRWFSIAAQEGDAEAAAKRDEVARRLDKQTLASLQLALQSWRPKSLIEEANTVPEPEGGWGDEAAVAAEPALDNSDLVRRAQMLLAVLGYQPGPADGQFGSRTRNAVREFQRARGLSETGDVTPELLDALSGAAG